MGVNKNILVSEKLFDDALNWFVRWYTFDNISVKELSEAKINHMKAIAKDKMGKESAVGELISIGFLISEENFELLYSNIILSTPGRGEQTGIDGIMLKDNLIYFVEIKSSQKLPSNKTNFYSLKRSVEIQLKDRLNKPKEIIDYAGTHMSKKILKYSEIKRKIDNHEFEGLGAIFTSEFFIKEGAKTEFDLYTLNHNKNNKDLKIIGKNILNEAKKW